MTVLSAAQTASRLMGKSPPTSLFNSGVTDSYALELAAIAQESATAIARNHDWRKFATLGTMTGDGSTTSFSLPSDYDRMPKKAELWSSSDNAPLLAARDLDHWLDLQLSDFVGGSDVWIMLGGTIQIRNAPASGELIKFYYQSNLIITPNTGSNKTAFTLDDDTFRLSERLLQLDMIWRWRSMKKLDYAEEMQNFEIAQAQEIVNDKGARILSLGAPRMPADGEIAYPRTLSA